MGFSSRRAIPSPTGASLNLYTRLADQAPRAVLQVNHGLAEHAARYERFAGFLAAHGIHTYAHDHRGHGFTSAPDAPPGRFGAPRGGDKVIADIAAIQGLIRAEHPGLPIVLFGHSMGGLIALNFLLRHPEGIRAAAIWNANFSAGLAGRAAQAILAWETFRLGSDVPSRLLPRLTFQAWGSQIPDRQTAFDWLSRDREEVNKYVEDPLCGWDGSVSMWQDVFGYVFFGANDRNFSRLPRDMPLNLVGGGQDPSTGGGRAVTDLARRLRRMGFSNPVSTIYPQSRHESLNDLNRNIIMSDFLDWLNATLAS